MFTVPCSTAAPIVPSRGRLSRRITHTTKDSFSSIFHEVMPSITDFSCDVSVEELSRFNSTCSNVLNAVASLGLFSLKPVLNPGLMILFVLSDVVVEEQNESGKRTGFMFPLRF